MQDIFFKRLTLRIFSTFIKMFLALDNVHLFSHCFIYNIFILYFSGNSHEGDMGNLRQSNAGVIDAELTLPLMTLAGDLGIVGRAIVVSKPISFVLPGYKTQSYV